jgi:hypothetical protein
MVAVAKLGRTRAGLWSLMPTSSPNWLTRFRRPITRLSHLSQIWHFASE